VRDRFGTKALPFGFDDLHQVVNLAGVSLVRNLNYDGRQHLWLALGLIVCRPPAFKFADGLHGIAQQRVTPQGLEP
jgi:hypothetical protein